MQSQYSKYIDGKRIWTKEKSQLRRPDTINNSLTNPALADDATLAKHNIYPTLMQSVPDDGASLQLINETNELVESEGRHVLVVTRFFRPQSEVDAEAALAEQQSFEDDVQAHGLSVIALGSVLQVFGLSFPVSASEVDKDIKRKLAAGQLTPEQVPFVSLLSLSYSDLKPIGDDRIVQIAGYLQDNPQVAQSLMEGAQ